MQAALTVWVLALMLRALGFGGRPLLLLGVTAALSGLTTLPWLTSILLTDIFAGLAVLAVHLLVFADDALRRWERLALVALIAFAVATHSATFAVRAGAARRRRAGVRGCFADRLAPPASRAASPRWRSARVHAAQRELRHVAGRFAWTPGGLALSFGRMLQDGIVARYLAEHCPDKRLRLCAHRARAADRRRRVLLERRRQRVQPARPLRGPRRRDGRRSSSSSLRDYPAWQLETGAGRDRAPARPRRHRRRRGQHRLAHLLGDREVHARARRPPCTPPASSTASSDFAAINRIHQPVALAAMLLLLATDAAGAARREPFADLGMLAGDRRRWRCSPMPSSAACFANPHDRYGARLVWLAPLVVALALCRLYAPSAELPAGRLAAGSPVPLAADALTFPPA